MSRSRALVLASAVLLAGATGCTGSSDEQEETGRPVSPVSVELSPEGMPDEVSVGVVVSLGSAPGEGAQWSEAAEGAQVAAYRYGLGDAGVTIEARDDQGTAKGADQAVRELVDAGVAGIVLATEGDHVRGAVQAATELGVPLLLPYEDGTGELPEGVWSTGATETDVADALAAALEASGSRRPALVDAGSGDVPGLSTVAELSLPRGGDATGLAGRLARQTRSGDVDSVVVSGPAELQAQVVQALQAADVAVPVFLTGDAVSPTFADTLARTGGSLSAPLTTAGLDTDDVAALDPTSEGAAVSAYLAALRMTAEDGDVTDLFDGEPFETVAAAADVRSHDAVVALVTAAAAAGSDDPAAVGEALSSLVVGRTSGVAGPELDFSSSAAVPAEAVVPLQATMQDPGLRPVSTEQTPRLFWFAAPPPE